MSKIADKINQYKYAFAIWTDRADFIVDKSEALNEDKLLEIRCFDKNGEYHAYRSFVTSDFTEREITQDDKYDGWYDEPQYLDIDAQKSNGLDIMATGGGKYHLPVEAKKITVRFYYKFNEDGVAEKVDFRLVEFE